MRSLDHNCRGMACSYPWWTRNRIGSGGTVYACLRAVIRTRTSDNHRRPGRPESVSTGGGVSGGVGRGARPRDIQLGRAVPAHSGAYRRERKRLNGTGSGGLVSRCYASLRNLVRPRCDHGPLPAPASERRAGVEERRARVQVPSDLGCEAGWGHSRSCRVYSRRLLSRLADWGIHQQLVQNGPCASGGGPLALGRLQFAFGLHGARAPREPVDAEVCSCTACSMADREFGTLRAAARLAASGARVAAEQATAAGSGVLCHATAPSRDQGGPQDHGSSTRVPHNLAGPTQGRNRACLRECTRGRCSRRDHR